MTEDFRCSLASLASQEVMAGTAPVERAWILVEDHGPWGRKALAESRLPEPVRERLGGLSGVRVQLIRRHGSRAADGVQAFTATATATGFAVGAARLDDARDLLDLDLDGLAEGRGAGLPAYDGPLWLVCTNGRRDLCCAEQGRPVAAALGERWPEATWETTHLGGHRFAATLLALPSGAALGRLDAGSAVAAVESLGRGELPLDVLRGRAGWSPAAQVADLHLRHRLGLLDPHAVTAEESLSGAEESLSAESGVRRIRLLVQGATHDLVVRQTPGPLRRLSCADDVAKPTSGFVVEDRASRPEHA